MIEFNETQILIVRNKLAKAVTRNGFESKLVDQLLPRRLDIRTINTRINMFLVIGINSTGRTIAMNNAMVFVGKGINRFFLSLKNRRDLAEKLFEENRYEGKYNLSADYYAAPAVFDADEIPGDVMAEWNEMMKPIRIKSRHGVKIEKNRPKDGSIDSVKYVWVDRGLGPIRTPKKK